MNLELVLRDERLEAVESLLSVLNGDCPLCHVLLEEAVEIEDFVRHIFGVLRSVEHELAVHLR